MSKATSNASVKNKIKETSKISTRTDPTTKRASAAAKPSTTTKTTLAKKQTITTKAVEDKDKKRVSQSTTTKSKPPTVKPTNSSTHTTPRAPNSTRKSLDPAKNVSQPRTSTKAAPAPSTSSQKQPLRAKHTTEIKQAIQRNSLAKTATSATAVVKNANSKPNAVLDTPHNVTVASPPAKRKNETATGKSKSGEREEIVNTTTEHKQLTRKGSRVLAPDEIVVLKRESAKKRLEEQILRDDVAQQEQQKKSVAKSKPEAAKESREEKPLRDDFAQQEQRNNSLISLPDPVAFEVNFEDNDRPVKEKSKRERSRSRPRVKPTAETKTKEDEANYSDDFDSYESDFETESSTHDTSQHSTEDSEETNEDSTEEESTSNDSDKDKDDTDEEDTESECESKKDNNKDPEETEDESEFTQDPVTVLQRDKERKLDSGHYEMNSRRNPKLSETSFNSHSTQLMQDSLNAFCLNTSDQLDSGISAYGPMTLTNFHAPPPANYQVYYGGYKDFKSRPVLNKRGSDLMSKIQFDSLGFTLLDLKPISYDVYMQTYGRLNTGQVATQTQDDLMHVDQQTEPYETRSMWTQHPAQYDLAMVQQMYKEGALKGMMSQNCCGEEANSDSHRLTGPEDLDDSLEALKNLANQRSQRNLHNHVQSQRKPVNYESLNSFLLRSSMVINQILGSSSEKKGNYQTVQNLGNLKDITESCYNMECNFLNTLRVVKIFSNPKHNLFVTVHESRPDTDVYKSEFSQLLMVWCINSPNKPLRLLTTWSNVSRLEISNDSSDIIVGALHDGSVALWDLRETYSFCSKLDGYLTHFAATQSIVPCWGGQAGKVEILLDMGSCLDVRSFRSPTNKWGLASSGSISGPKNQFVSLHDSGILTVWSLIESSELANMSPVESSHKPHKHKYSSKSQQKFGYSSPWARVKLIQSSIVQLKDYLETNSVNSQSRFDKTKALFQKNIYSDEALKELHDASEGYGQQGLRFTSIECGSETIFVCTNRNFIMVCSKTLKTERFRRVTLNENRLLFPTALKVLSNENFLAVGLSNGAVVILNCALNKLRLHRDKAEKCKTPATPFPGQSSPSDDIDPMSGKSCAIQNIVLNSQKSYDSMDFTSFPPEEFRPNTAAFIALIDSQQKPFELRVYDQQIILSGSVLRRNLIQSLELSSDGWRLFALSNNRIRVYDFYMDQEISAVEECQEPGDVVDIACSKANSNELNLITLEKDSRVTVCCLKK